MIEWLRQTAVYQSLKCWIGLPRNIMLLRQEKSQLEAMQKMYPNRIGWYLAPKK